MHSLFGYCKLCVHFGVQESSWLCNYIGNLKYLLQREKNAVKVSVVITIKESIFNR